MVVRESPKIETAVNLDFGTGSLSREPSTVLRLSSCLRAEAALPRS
jgi:hypothetical protein